MTEQRCGTCRWFERAVPDDPEEPDGWCLWLPKRHPYWLSGHNPATADWDGEGCMAWEAPKE